jgi:hypothetical protein
MVFSAFSIAHNWREYFIGYTKASHWQNTETVRIFLQRQSQRAHMRHGQTLTIWRLLLRSYSFSSGSTEPPTRHGIWDYLRGSHRELEFFSGLFRS